MYDRKCIDGDSDHQTSTGIQRHRLRALFERDDYGNTAGADAALFAASILSAVT